MTPVDIAGFQRLNLGPDGKKLLPDGILGPKTQWALALDGFPGWRKAIVVGALQFVGIQETGGENRGPEIDVWLGACGVQQGNPWCAAFVSAMLRLAGISMSCALVRDLPRHLERTETPLPGDVSYWVRPDGTGHCGIVTGISRFDVSVVEGNSGDGVRAGRRTIGPLAFLSSGKPMMPSAWEGLPMLGSKTT